MREVIFEGENSNFGSSDFDKLMRDFHAEKLANEYHSGDGLLGRADFTYCSFYYLDRGNVVVECCTKSSPKKDIKITLRGTKKGIGSAREKILEEIIKKISE